MTLPVTLLMVTAMYPVLAAGIAVEFLAGFAGCAVITGIAVAAGRARE